MTTPGYPGDPSAEDPQDPAADPVGRQPTYGRPQVPRPPGPSPYGEQPQSPTAGQWSRPSAYGQQPQAPRPPAPNYPSPPAPYAQPGATGHPGQTGQTIVDRFKVEAANRPSTVVAGCVTLAASAVVFGLWYAIMLIMALTDPFIGGGLAMLDTFSGGAVTGTVIVMIILTLATICLALVAAWQVWKGSNGWRITGLVLGILMAVYNLFLVMSGGFILMGLLALLASIAVIILWFLTPSNLWFNAQRPQTYSGPQPPMPY